MNKHQKLAIVIAPFLAIGGYIAADYYQKHQLQEAMQNRAGRLQLQGACQLPQSVCVFRKDDLELTLRVDQANASLLLEANHPLDGITLAFGQQAPVNMQRKDDAQHWQLARPVGISDRLRLVTSIQGVFYFAETP